MKRLKLITLGLCTGMLLVGCESKDAANNTQSEDLSQVISETGEVKQTTVETEQTADTVKGDFPAPSESDKEMFDSWANDLRTNGFMSCEFTNPSNADYNQVFYCGAKINKEVTQEDSNEYERITGDYFCGDLLAISKSEMDSFLKQYVGITSDDITYDFMAYSKKTDCYYKMVSDTNYRPYICVGVKQEGNDYTVRFEEDVTANPGSEPDRITASFTKYDSGLVIKSVEHDDKSNYETTKPEKLVEEYSDIKYITYTYNYNDYEETNIVITSLDDTILEKHYEYDNFYYFYNDDNVCYYKIYCATEGNDILGSKRNNAPDDVVYYGDTLKVQVSELDPSVDLLENPKAEKKWMPAVEKTIVVDNTCEELRTYENAETPYDFMSNIKNIIGLKVGDTLESVDGGTGGGSLYYKITIKEIEHNNNINTESFYD